MGTGDLNRIFDSLAFSAMDLSFARLMFSLSDGESHAVAIASALAGYFTQKGDVCLNVHAIAGRRLSGILDEPVSIDDDIEVPEYGTLIHELLTSGVTGKPGEFKPLILDDNGRLYLHRYWEYEHSLAGNILSRLGPHGNIDMDWLDSRIKHYFPGYGTGEPDRQREAVFNALQKKFYVISGGPGTGKTRAAAWILTLIMEQAVSRGRKIQVALAAPTGKAAARLKDSIMNSLSSMDIPEHIRSSIPVDAGTLHRLMEPVYMSNFFRHDSSNPLPHDAFIIDESSMIDLPLMSKFFQAARPDSRIILLGDRDQLSSIESGAVFADICGSGPGRKSVPGHITFLDKNWRFGKESGIGRFSRAVREGNRKRAVEILTSGRYDDLIFRPVKSMQRMMPELKEIILDRYTRHFKAGSPDRGLEIFSGFRVLSPVRKGFSGTEYLNDFAEDVLHASGWTGERRGWYQGRPVIINKNRYDLKLFNGDTGMAWKGIHEDGRLRAYFHAHGGGEGVLHGFMPAKLPDHEPAYAMTVHKSQGSEFDEILIILPDRMSPVLSRELLFTAVTRARKRAEIWGLEDLVGQMVDNPMSRSSGLADMLQGMPVK